MRLIVMFSSQPTISSLYKLAVHRAIFCPTLHHKNTDATACDITATCNDAYLGTRSTPLKTTNSSTSESNYLVGCQWKSTCTSPTMLWVQQRCRIYQHNYYENLQLTLAVESTNVRILVQLSGLQCWEWLENTLIAEMRRRGDQALEDSTVMLEIQ